ncbi:efflux RND transporter periplasmic adaptor subunit [Botrimarina hoheduenensis]|uniref:efflux RND transporter periplasmic adaptor subunit n=1 Tax=Botrimarina hoheduenensis TaxID=2528000 RepID=UPI0018D47534|nr:efflux RND transporter periplasmic adaptor subunit [Botrimarina hoheduenensis]
MRINRAPAVLAFAGAVLLLRTNTAESTPPPNVLPVQVAPAEEVDTLLRKRVYTGTLVAARRSALSFETAGKIVELVADEGDRVEAGQILGRLDTRRLEALRAQSQAELVESAARLREFIAGPRTQTIAAAEAEVRNLAAQRDVAQRNLERRAQLVASRAISREEYDEMLFEFRAAEARVDVAQKTLDELIAGTRQEQIDAQQARTQALEAVVADTRHRLEDAVLRAPFAGQIVKRNLDEGTVVALGEPVFELIEAAALEAWIGAPPRAVATLTPGAAMRVEIDNEEYEAVVQSIRPELDPQTRTQNVVLRIPRDPRLVAGQVVRAAIVQPIAMRGFWTPTASLTPRRRGLWAVYVVAAGRVEPRDVEVIETDGDRSFIRGTLAPGEPVIAEGAHRIVAGQAVTIASERPAVTATTKPR